ncbi:MAG: PadR family transcriptional regulator [Chloroflexi bacterium]|nr:PadR family transcriptional regulator [Chloroflexota bacterium]
MAERDLSTLEYIVLGLISRAPQSGYSIISALEAGIHRWSASPGSIYPILKRLEKAEHITGELEAVYETRPRKMYHLTPAGERLLDDWLRGPISDLEVLEDRDVALIKFQFAEARLTPGEIVAWLDQYEELTDTYDTQHRLFPESDTDPLSLHPQLVHEMTMMEINMQRTWIQMARRRVLAG